MLSLIGGADVWRWIVTGEWPWLLLMVASVALIAVMVAWSKIRSVKLLDADDCQHFFPFLNGLDEHDRLRFYLPRPATLARLQRKLNIIGQNHLLMVGESGSGKSTLLDVLSTQDQKSTILSLPAADVEFQTIIRTLVGENAFQNDPTLNSLFEAVVEFTNDPGHLQSSIDLVAQHISQNVSGSTILVIDQAERIKPQLDRAPVEVRRTTLLLIESLRCLPNVVIIFSVKSDLMADIITLFGETGYQIFFLQGFDMFESLSAREILSSKLRSISLSNRQIDSILDDLSQSGSVNAFDFQMTGYVYECFGSRFVQASRSDKPHSRRFYFELFHDGMFAEYGKLMSDHFAASDVEVLLFVIAYFNSRRSLPLLIKDAALISHLPKSNFESALRYIEKRKLLDTWDRKNNSLRLSHDRVIEQVLMKEPKYLQPDQQVAIEKIIEEFPTRKPKFQVLDHVSPFLNFARRDEFGHAEYGNPETELLWIFAILYFLRIAYPHEFFNQMSDFNGLLDATFPGIVFPPDQSNLFFAPIAFTQYLWVSIIYGLNRGFFFYFWQGKKDKVMPALLQIIGPLGALMGLLLSFAPALFIIPIAVPGVLLGAVYLIISRRSKAETAIFRYLNVLGWATIGNMAISFGVSYLLIDTMNNLSATNVSELVLVNLLICSLFCYFAYQMRWRQGTNAGRCRMLTMYSAGRDL